MQNLKGYGILSIVFFGLILLASCSSLSSSSAGEDKTYLSPIPESTILAYRVGTPVTDKLQAVIAAREMILGSRIKPVQPPDVVSVEHLTFAEFQKKTGKPIDQGNADKLVWFVIFKGKWQGYPPRAADETVVAPPPVFEGCQYVLLTDLFNQTGGIHCPDTLKNQVEEEVNIFETDLENGKAKKVASPPPDPDSTPSVNWDGKIVVPTGIIEDPAVVGHDILRIENGWQYLINGEYVRVYAGCLSDDREQGAIAYETDSSSRQVINAPKRSGSLKIIEEKNNGETLVLKSQNGDTFYFDVQARQFVTELIEATTVPYYP